MTQCSIGSFLSDFLSLKTNNHSIIGVHYDMNSSSIYYFHCTGTYISKYTLTYLFTLQNRISFVGVAYCQSSPLAFGNNLSNSRPIALTSIKDAIPTTPVVVISKSYCPYSRGAKVGKIFSAQ